MEILVVGAGFAGACYARHLAEKGFRIHVIDKRPHIAGNAYDEIREGTRVHVYGPHLFHTNNDAVVSWLKRFGNWLEYRHSVSALLPDGRLTPLPVNLQTLSDVSGVELDNEEQAREYLTRVRVDIPDPANAEEFLLSSIGRKLTELFFARYTQKMWGLPLSALDKSVVQRLPLRFNFTNEYFPNDQHQILPEDGYTGIFARIFDHPKITVSLSTAYDKAMSKDVRHTFNSMPIDEYYDYRFDPLPYRSIKFHHALEADPHPSIPVINFTDKGPITRRTVWSAFPGHGQNNSTAALVTREEPCDYEENDFERYYPIKTADNSIADRLALYQALAATEKNVTFIGRCGTYQYLDMHQVINQSLQGAEKWFRLQKELVC